MSRDEYFSMSINTRNLKSNGQTFAGPRHAGGQRSGALALGLLAMLTVMFAPAGQAFAQRTTDAPPVVDHGANFVEITRDSRVTVERGLEYLASKQSADGSWGGDRYGKHVGITALACLAFMADGSFPGRGPYGQQVERGLDFVLASAQETGFIAADTSHGPMYGHGFATLFLGEIYGMSPDPRVREALVKAVRLIVSTQNDEGGWRYHPIPNQADISVTICQIMALRSAREAGIHVPHETILRAIEYVEECQDASTGGFRYMLNGGGPAFPRSAAGVASLYYAGVYEGNAIEQGLQYLKRERQRTGNRDIGHYYYGHYYAAQAMFLAGGEHWQGWFPGIRDELIARQRNDGGWPSSHGDSYATAMALLIIQVPNRYLPIFQR